MASLLTYGNHARDLEVIWNRVRPGNPLNAYDDDPETGKPALPDNLTGRILIGTNDSKLRRQIAQRFGHLNGTHPLVDPSAVIGPDVTLGRGVVVAPQTALVCSVSLGNHVHLNYTVGITRSTVGDYSTLSPGAVVCGNVEIGEACFIGAGAVVCERSFIGNEVTVAAGAIIPPYSKVPDGVTVVGVWK